MANRDEHDVLGGLIGVVSAFVAAAKQGREPHPLELLGGVLGGVAGSRLPDAFEPAVHPNHRQFAHSVTFALGTGATVAPAGFRAQQSLAEQAEQIAETDPVSAALLRVFGGMAAGAAPGYLSHLAADARTPKSIPLLGKL